MKANADPIALLRKARPFIAAAVTRAQADRDAEGWERASALLRDIDAATAQPYSVMMRLLENEWVGIAAADVGSAGDRELSHALAHWTNVTVDVQGKPMLMRVVERTVDGNVATFELAEPR